MVSMKKIAIVLIALFMVVPVSGQSAGKTGMSFLKMGFGARVLALGDVGSVFGDDVSSLYYNPAHLAGSTDTEIMVMHNQWIQDVRSEVLGAKFQLFGHPFAVGIQTTNVGDIEVRTKPGDPVSTISANYFAGSLSTGFRFGDKLKAGVTVKYLYEGILADDATGFGFDFGAGYQVNKSLTIAASIRNIGSMSAFRVEETKLPADLRIGAGYTLETPFEKFGITLGAEFQKYLQQDDSHINFGGEITYDNLLAIRLGYMTMYEARNFTGGLGLSWGMLGFDYAITPFSDDLGVGHTVSVKLAF